MIFGFGKNKITTSETIEFFLKQINDVPVFASDLVSDIEEQYNYGLNDEERVQLIFELEALALWATSQAWGAAQENRDPLDALHTVYVDRHEDEFSFDEPLMRTIRDRYEKYYEVWSKYGESQMLGSQMLGAVLQEVGFDTSGAKEEGSEGLSGQFPPSLNMKLGLYIYGFIAEWMKMTGEFLDEHRITD